MIKRSKEQSTIGIVVLEKNHKVLKVTNEIYLKKNHFNNQEVPLPGDKLLMKKRHSS